MAVRRRAALDLHAGATSLCYACLMFLPLVILALATSAPPPTLSVTSAVGRREVVATGPFTDMSKLEAAAQRCGFKEIGFAVPEGLLTQRASRCE